MLTNPSAYASFKARSIAGQSLTLEEKYRVLEALYDHARLLGHFGKGDQLLGLEDDVRLAAALNANVSSPPR